MHRPRSLWAITSHFNPSGYKRRLSNYRAFRRHLPLPLVTVELSFGAQFELNEDDADILIQLRGRDVLWQKERLLNLALKALPHNCEKVLWIDADVVFEKSDWCKQAEDRLDEYPLVHLFSERVNLSRGQSVPPSLCEDRAAVSVDSKCISIGYKIAEGIVASNDLHKADAPLVSGSTTGLAWGARRSLLEEHGFYDRCVVGSADRAMLCAGLGEFSYASEALKMNQWQREDYLVWAHPFFESVGGRISYVDGRIFHLWHGKLQDRRYSERQDILEAFRFNPSKDIALDRNGCWKWSSDKPELHQQVRVYFDNRKEDG